MLWAQTMPHTSMWQKAAQYLRQSHTPECGKSGTTHQTEPHTSDKATNETKPHTSMWQEAAQHVK